MVVGRTSKTSLKNLSPVFSWIEVERKKVEHLASMANVQQVPEAGPQAWSSLQYKPLCL